MTYPRSHKQKPNLQKTKQKITSFIPPELIKNNQFQDVISLVNEKLAITEPTELTELSKRDRYLYGYSLLRTHQSVPALATLWPLAVNGPAELQNDCAVIATHVFNDPAFLSTSFLSSLTAEMLLPLFFVAQNLMPQHQIYPRLKQHLFDVLWQNGEYEKLERLLKSCKEEFSETFVENISKLIFFQSEKKLPANIPLFIGQVLTGGACLLERNAIYHNDIAEEIALLANELKCLYAQWKLNKEGLAAWDQSLFDYFVDYEASVLVEVLQLVLKDKKCDENGSWKVIPAPSYLAYHLTADRYVSPHFLPWLATENEALVNMYSPDVSKAVLWALNGKALSDIRSILKSVDQSKLDPYLRLALVLRAELIQPSSLQGLVDFSEFTTLNKYSGLFKAVVINTISSLKDNVSRSLSTTGYWKIIDQFYPAIRTPESDALLIIDSLAELHRTYEDGYRQFRLAYKDDFYLPLDKIKKVAEQTHADALLEHIDLLLAERERCHQFLVSLDDEKNAKKYIKDIKDESALRALLVLIANTCLLLRPEESDDFFNFLKTLVTHRRINKILPLKTLSIENFKCTCHQCRRQIKKIALPAMLEEFQLPVVHLPEAHAFIPLQTQIQQTTSQKILPSSSVLVRPDPFKVLTISLTEIKPKIMQKVMQLIQHSPEKMAEFRNAQSELFHPAQRFVHHYLRYLAHEENNDKNENTNDDAVTNTVHFKPQEIPLRPVFL